MTSEITQGVIASQLRRTLRDKRDLQDRIDEMEGDLKETRQQRAEMDEQIEALRGDLDENLFDEEGRPLEVAQ